MLFTCNWYFSNYTYPAFSWWIFGKYKIEWKERTWEYFYSECNSKWPIGVKYTLYTHSLLIQEEDNMVVSTSWRSSQFSCKPNTMINWLNCWDLLLDIWEYTGTPPTGNWFFQWRRDPSKMSLTWYSWEKNALLQEVETIMVSSLWASRECVYGLWSTTLIYSRYTLRIDSCHQRWVWECFNIPEARCMICKYYTSLEAPEFSLSYHIG